MAADDNHNRREYSPSKFTQPKTPVRPLVKEKKPIRRQLTYSSSSSSSSSSDDEDEDEQETTSSSSDDDEASTAENGTDEEVIIDMKPDVRYRMNGNLCITLFPSRGTKNQKR